MTQVRVIPVKQRRDTTAGWTDANPVLKAGQIGWDTDEEDFKVGDGASAWLDLDYYSVIHPGGGGGGVTDHGALTGLSDDDHTQYHNDSRGDARYEAKNSNIQSHIASTSNPHSVTKSQVGLSNVDNTSDVNKPVSTAQQTAFNLKANKVTITGATKTKVTYNADGIVTSGADATTSDISEGSNLYFTNARVLAAVLSGFSAASGAISSADSILVAFNKIAYFITNIGATVRATVLSGFSTVSPGSINSSDTVEGAISKLDANFNMIASEVVEKADKAGATAGDILVDDGSGNPIDSSKFFSDAGVTTDEILSAAEVDSRISAAVTSVKEYTVYTTQSGTSAPTIDALLINTIGDTFTLNYVGVGHYRIQADTINPFTSVDKMFPVDTGSADPVYAHPVFSFGGVIAGWVKLQYNTTDRLEIFTFDASGSMMDGILSRFPLSFKIYS